MSVRNEIDRIQQNIANTYAVLSALGADTPTEATSDNLPTTAGNVKVVRYDAQTLTDSEKSQARTNIGAASSASVPTKTSQLTNDSGFLTSHQDISGKLDKSGGTMTGKLVAQNNTNYTTKQVRNVFLIADGNSLPSGANGDICLVYTP